MYLTLFLGILVILKYPLSTSFFMNELTKPNETFSFRAKSLWLGVWFFSSSWKIWYVRRSLGSIMVGSPPPVKHPLPTAPPGGLQGIVHSNLLLFLCNYIILRMTAIKRSGIEHVWRGVVKDKLGMSFNGRSTINDSYCVADPDSFR